MICAFAIPAFAQKIDTFGYYFIEKPTKDFSNISEIHLAGDYGAKERPAMFGLIRMKKKSAKDFKLRKTFLSNRELSFTSETVGGVYYTFTGTFVRSFPTKIQARMDKNPDGIVLTGTLTKFQAKKKTASANVKFTYSGGD